MSVSRLQDDGEHQAVSSLDALCDPETLRKRLVASFQSSSRRDIVVGVILHDEMSLVALSDENDGPYGVRETFIRLGCVAKLFTGVLVRRAIAAGLISLSTVVSDLLPLPVRGTTPITVRHLLEHTHGLDESALNFIPRLSTGHLDVEQLCAVLDAAPVLHEPGELYSYSHAGAWLCGAILERLHGSACLTQLQELVRELDSQISIIPGKQGCASVGGGLRVRADGVLRMLGLQFIASDSGKHWLTENDIAPVPGWNALERGVRLGWKYSGSGWFGHSSALPGWPLMVRVHPARRIGLMIASRHQAPALVAAHVFGKEFPELVSFRGPRPLEASQLEALDLDRYTGTYRNAALSLRISMNAPRSLELLPQLTNPSASETLPARLALRVAREHLLLTQPQSPHVPYVQCVFDHEGCARHLWDGQKIFRRVNSTCEDPAARV